MKLLLSIITLIIAITIPAPAQTITLTPHRAHDALPLATAAGRSLLAPDASLVFIGAIGNDTYELNGMQIPLLFELDSGRATAWVYQYYSPSLVKHVLIVAIDIPSMGFDAFEAQSPVPIPDLTQPLATDLPHAGSDRMIERLKSDSVYQRYRADYPSARPATLSYRPIIIDDRLILPGDFPLEGTIWNLNFTGAGDATMTCYVDATTGRTFCLRSTNASSVPGEEREGRGMELSRK